MICNNKLTNLPNLDSFKNFVNKYIITRFSLSKYNPTIFFKCKKEIEILLIETFFKIVNNVKNYSKYNIYLILYNINECSKDVDKNHFTLLVSKKFLEKTLINYHNAKIKKKKKQIVIKKCYNKEIFEDFFKKFYVIKFSLGNYNHTYNLSLHLTNYISTFLFKNQEEHTKNSNFRINFLKYIKKDITNNNFNLIINQKFWERSLVKYPIIQKISDFNYLSSLNLEYLNEILLLPDDIDIPDYFYFKLCKEFNFTHSNNDTKFDLSNYLEIIRSQSFIDRYHNKINFNLNKLTQLVTYYRHNNYVLLKKHDIRFKSVGKHYIPKNNLKSISNDENDINISNSSKLLTFIMILKNRNLRAKRSIEYLVNNLNKNYCKFLIVEDKGNDLLDLNNFKYKHFITHYLVDSKCSWNRSGLLNFGIKRCTTPYFVAWDCDFFITKDLVFDLNQLIINYQPMNIIGIQCFDTDICDYIPTFNLPCTPYGHLWLYNLEIVKSVGMFNSEFIGWGLEEKELEVRIKNKFNLDVIKTDKISPCFHHSHNNKLRPKREEYNKYLYDTCITYKIVEIDNYVDYEILEEKKYIF